MSWSLFCTNCTISIPHVHIFVCITIQFSMLESFSHSLILLQWFPNCSNLSFKIVYILRNEILPYTSFGFFQQPSPLHHHHLDFPIPTRAANFNPKEGHVIITDSHEGPHLCILVSRGVGINKLEHRYVQTMTFSFFFFFEGGGGGVGVKCL